MNGDAPRLGRVEQVILHELGRRGVLTPRDALVQAAFPAAEPDGDGADVDAKGRRARAESAVSRAIRSLEHKGLVVRERDARTRRTFVRTPGDTTVPRWEQLARAEEDLSAHCRQRARAWQELAASAGRRARQLRVDRSSAGTEVDRARDLERLARLEGGAP